MRLELFGPHERVEQIDQDDHGDRAAKNQIKHRRRLPLGPRTQRDVDPHRGKETDADDQHEDVRTGHSDFSSYLAARGGGLCSVDC